MFNNISGSIPKEIGNMTALNLLYVNIHTIYVLILKMWNWPAGMDSTLNTLKTAYMKVFVAAFSAEIKYQVLYLMSLAISLI